MYDRHIWRDANRVARDVIRVKNKTRRDFKILSHTQVNNAKFSYSLTLKLITLTGGTGLSGL